MRVSVLLPCFLFQVTIILRADLVNGKFVDYLLFQKTRVQYVYPTDGAYLSKGVVHFQLFHPLAISSQRFQFYIEMEGQEKNLAAVKWFQRHY